MSRRNKLMIEKLSPLGRVIRASGSGRFYHDGDGAGFVWRWWHPLSWLVAPLLLVIASFGVGAPEAWRERHKFGWRMNPWFVANPDRLKWERQP